MSRRAFWLAFLGLFFTQLAWIIVVPPYRGIDEHEHAFKAAAVAQGDYALHHQPAALGWGEYVEVPADIAAAARPSCLDLRYTHLDNCVGPTTGDGLVRVASSAARYSPFYPTLVGWVTRVINDGTDALLAMRALSALMCSAVFALALSVLLQRARTLWVTTGALLALTPTVVYTTSVVAPNGLEMAAGALLWAALLWLRDETGGPHAGAVRETRRPTLLAILASVLLLLLRSTGPLWWLAIMGSALPLFSRQRLGHLLRSRMTWWWAGAVLVVTTIAATWTIAAGTNNPADSGRVAPGSPWPELFGKYLMWFYQSIAAMPLREDVLPTPLYAIAFTCIVLVTLAAALSGERRLRASALTVVVIASIISITASVLAYRDVGWAWQGRYLLPLTLGFFFLLGVALDGERASRIRLQGGFAALVATGACAAEQTIATLHVRSHVSLSSPLIDAGLWHPPGPTAVALLAVMGPLLVACSGLFHIRSRLVAVPRVTAA